MADFLLSVGVDVGLSYTEMQKDIGTLVSQLNSNPPRIKVALDIDDATISNLRNQIDGISKTLGTNGAAVNANSANSNAATVNGQLRERIILENQVRQATTASAAAKGSADAKATEDETKRQALLKKSYTLLTQMQSAESKWTKAKTGKSASSYAAIQSDISSLQQWNLEFKSGRMTADDFSEKIQSLSTNFATNSNIIKQAGEATKIWSERIGGLASKFGSWFSITRVIMAVYRAIRQMVSASIELQDAFTQLKIVTGATDDEMKDFYDTSVSLAKNLGKSVTDVTKSIEVFSRLGYSLGDASKLAEYATILSNVAAVDTDAATTGLTSIVKGFGLDVTEVEHVADVLVSVGQNYAVSAEEMMEAFEKSGAALNATNTSFEKSAGLIAAANASVQNASTVGTALKTVSARIRGSKTDLEELGEDTTELAEGFSKYSKEIKALTGFNIMVEGTTDEFKDLYDIMDGIAGVWDNLSNTQQARVSEILGGTRQLQVISSIIGNWGDAVDAYSDAMNSAGVATEANNTYMDTASAHIKQFKATFQDLSQNLINADFITGVVDLGTGLLNILNVIAKITESIGGLRTVLMTVAAIFLTIKVSSIKDMLLMLISPISKLSSFIGKLGNGFAIYFKTIRESIAISGQAALKINTLSKALNKAGIAASAAQIKMAAFMIVLTLITAIIGKVKQAQEEAEQKAQEVVQRNTQAAQTASTLSDELFTLINKYIELNDVVGVNNSNIEQVIQTKNDLIEKMQLEEGELDKLVKKYGSYSDAVKQATAQKLRDAERDLRGGIGSYEDELLQAAQIKYYAAGVKRPEGAQTPTYNLTNMTVTKSVKKDAEFYQAIEALKNSSEFFAGVGPLGFTVSIEGMDYKDLETADGVLLAYDKLGEALDLVQKKAGTNNEVWNTLYAQYSAVSDAVNNYRSAIGDLNKNLAQQYMLNGLIGQEIPKTQEEFDSYKDRVVDAAVKSKEFIGSEREISAAIDKVLMQQPQFMKFYEDLIKETEKSTTANNTFVSSLSKINELDTGLSELDKIYADIFNKGDFDWNSILDNKAFADAFSGLGDVYTDFIETVANSPSDINACQDAFDNLVSAYIMSSDVLEKVTDKTRDTAVAMLEQKGVANAAAIIDERLAINKERLRVETELSADATYRDVLALYESNTVSELTAQALYELAIAKMQTNENTIITSNDIDQLYSLAVAANATTASIQNLAKAKALMTELTAESKRVQNLIITENITDPRGLSSVRWKERMLQSQIDELVSTPIKYNTQKLNYTGGSSTKSAQNSASKAAEKASKDAETWFEKQLRDHQHLVAMEKESEAEYLDWLSKAYPKAYKEGIIGLEDYYKYQEEVFEGLRDLFLDSLNDIEHEISMRENYDGESDKIISLYKKLMKDVEKEISAARARGLDDTDDYIQELQSKWQDYAGSIKDIQEDVTESAKDAIDELVDYRIDMLKQDVESEKDALDKKLDYLKEFYDKQKDMLQDQYDEEQYLEEQAEKRKSVSDLQSEIAMLENDDSAWAQKRKLELQEELATAQDDLGEFEDEHALDLALDALDNAYNEQEARIQAEMDALEEKLNDPEALFNQALSDIKNNTGNLYQEMLEFNRKYGTGNDEDVKDIYEEAYKALLEYKDVYGKDYNGVVLTNSTNYKPETGSWDTEKISGTNTSNKKTTTTKTKTTTTKSSAPSLSKGSSITVKKSATHFGSKSGGAKMASFVPGGKYTVYQTSGNQVLIGRNGVYTGWIKKSDIVGYASGTSNATAGLHSLDEIGSEYLFTSSDGTNYRVLNSGDKVLNAKATDFLYEFANGGGEILEKIVKSAFGTSLFDHIRPVVNNNEIKMGDIVVQGSANTQTVSEIRRAQRDNLTEMLKNLNKLNK